MNEINSKYSVVDLFCGIGGLSHGFYKENFKIVAGIDSDKTCKYAYEVNNESSFIDSNIQDISVDYLKELYPKDNIKILIGCAPCQPFSTYTKLFEKDEKKWGLLYEFGRLIEGVQPEIVSMENVPQLKEQKVFKDFVDLLKKNNYEVNYSVVKCVEYGIPQNRKRLVLLASKFGNLELIKPTHSKGNYKTVKDAIFNLEPIEDGQTSKKDKLHTSRKLTPINKKRIQNTPYGGSWENWSDELKLKCHKKESGKSFKNVYGRMKWEEPSPTITTQSTGIGNGRFGHPIQNRAISLREAALLQTFPKYYKIVSPEIPFSFRNYGTHIGNAVPVKLGKVIAKSIKKHLGGKDGRRT
jgi:DNA (cytosine-5)-methyltransferase 1